MCNILSMKTNLCIEFIIQTQERKLTQHGVNTQLTSKPHWSTKVKLTKTSPKRQAEMVALIIVLNSEQWLMKVNQYFKRQTSTFHYQQAEPIYR